MQPALHILHLEDDPLDTELIRRRLVEDELNCEIERVENEAEFSAALERGGVDLILADVSLPGYDGMEALKLVRSIHPGLPFILFSGVIGEESAVLALKGGATDYVLKDRPSRLAPAIRRAIEEVRLVKEEKSLGNQLTRAQKLEVFGELAGGIAHDFNNILTIIMANCGLLTAALKKTNRLYKYASHIEYATEHAAALTRQLLLFSRREIHEPVTLALNEVVKNTERLLRRLIPESIELSVSTSSEALHVKIDRNDIEQVLINLVMNARDAIPHDGWITISTGVVKSPGGDQSPSMCFVKVADTGGGISESVRSHLFEPFFTTKPEGAGTGLGLATCHRLISAAGGRIDVESEVGHGTVFTIQIPRVPAAKAMDESPSRLKKKAPRGAPRGDVTILLVEDNHTLRDMLAGRLSELGYHVLQAANGLDGLDVVAENKEHPPDLVITDVVLPLLSGEEMIRLLKLKNPHIKVLYTSGYPDRTISPHGILTPGIELLRKPFSISCLADKIYELLPRSSLRKS